VSGSDDGTIIIHNLRDGTYVRSIVDNGRSYSSPKASLGGSGDQLDTKRLSVKPEAGAPAPQVQQRKITWIGLSKEAYIVTYSADEQLLRTFSLNGVLISSRVVPEALHCFLLSEDGKVILTGGSSCVVVLRWVRTLELANDGARLGFEAVLDGSMDDIPPMASPIRSLHLTRLERHLLVGLESGEMRILAQDPNYLRQRLQNKLIEIGIL
jgi:hypothetical protein